MKRKRDRNKARATYNDSALNKEEEMDRVNRPMMTEMGSNKLRRPNSQKSVDEIIDWDLPSLWQWSSPSNQFDATDSIRGDS